MKRWLTLAACLTATSVSAEEKVLYLYSWESYFSAASIAAFEKETGIKVSYDLFDSNDMVETKMLTGKSGYDLVTVNLSPHFLRQLPVGVWGALDRSKLANFGNIDPVVLERATAVDPGNAPGVGRVGPSRGARSLTTQRCFRWFGRRGGSPHRNGTWALCSF